MQTKLYAPETGKSLYLMRGLPGSGKSTCARRLGGSVFSTDDFFMKDGIYQFDPKKIGQAHAWNQARVGDALEARVPSVIVDNTNTCAWEMRPYVVDGMAREYAIVLVEPDSSHKWDIETLARMNTHGVPEEAIKRMKERYQHDVTLQQILDSGSSR